MGSSRLALCAGVLLAGVLTPVAYPLVPHVPLVSSASAAYAGGSVPAVPVTSGAAGRARGPGPSSAAAPSATPHAPPVAHTRDSGPGLRHAVIGIVLAGVAAIVVLVRGSRRGRGTE